MCKNNNFKKYNAIGYNFKKDPIFIPASVDGWTGGWVGRIGWMDEPAVARDEPEGSEDGCAARMIGLEGWTGWLCIWTDGWGG